MIFFIKKKNFRYMISLVLWSNTIIGPDQSDLHPGCTQPGLLLHTFCKVQCNLIQPIQWSVVDSDSFPPALSVWLTCGNTDSSEILFLVTSCIYIYFGSGYIKKRSFFSVMCQCWSLPRMLEGCEGCVTCMQTKKACSLRW